MGMTGQPGFPQRSGQPGQARGAGGDRPDAREDPATITRNLKEAARHLVRRLDEEGIATALVVMVPHPHLGWRETHAAHLEAVRTQPQRLRWLAGGAVLGDLIMNTPPGEVTPEVEREFRQRAEQLVQEGATGFGEMISHHLCLAPNHNFFHTPADHPLFLLLADLAARYGMAIDLHMEAVTRQRPMPDNLARTCSANPTHLEPTIPALERLLAHNREARIVWQHIGWDNAGGEMTPQLVGELLARHPNLYIALRVEKRSGQVGGGGPMPNRLVGPDGQWDPRWRALVEAHPERVVLGSDEFVGADGEPPRVAASLTQTWGLLDQLPPDLAQGLAVTNPRRIYRLDPSPP